MSGGNCMGTGYGDGSIWAKNVAIRSTTLLVLDPAPFIFGTYMGDP